MFRPICILGVFALLSGVAACSGLLDSDQPPERVYWLQPLIVQETESIDSARPSLAVTVTAAPGLDTDRLLILEPGARLNNYAAARWPDNNPEVLASLLKITLESTGRYSRVMAGRKARATDWELDLDLREFYSLTEVSESVRMVLSGYVSCAESEHAIAMKANIGINDHRLSEIVAAYQRALHEVSQQLVTQLAESCEASERAAG